MKTSFRGAKGDDGCLASVGAALREPSPASTQARVPAERPPRSAILDLHYFEVLNLKYAILNLAWGS